MFKATTEQDFEGPHQNQALETSGASIDEAQAAMILIHGRGATAAGIMGLAAEFNMPEFHYLAPQAEGHTWYPYSFMERTEKNEPGISSGLQRIHDLFEHLEENGIEREHTILLGFSQGACLATEYAARHPLKFGGVIAYSGGLIGEEVDPGAYEGELESTPVFLGCSSNDPHIPESRVDETEEVMSKLNGGVTKKIYPNMGHTICEDEIEYTRNLMKRILDELS